MTEQAKIGNVFANISNSYFHLTVSEKKVADYVLAHTDVQFMSISELAYESGVAEATISRFCRRLKLKGYNAFKLAVAKATAEEHGGISPTMEGQEGEITPEDSIAERAAGCMRADLRHCPEHGAGAAGADHGCGGSALRRPEGVLYGAGRFHDPGGGGGPHFLHRFRKVLVYAGLP